MKVSFIRNALFLFIRLAEKLKQENLPKRNPVVPHTGIWIFGDPGVGKSFFAHMKYKDAFWKAPSNRWWDYYNGEKVVIVDEFVGGFLLSDLLLWADRYECKGEVKGAMIQLAHTTTVMLSNLPPWDLYPNVEPIRKAALYRRFKVYEMKATSRPNGSVHRQMHRRYDSSAMARPSNPVGQQLRRANATVSTSTAVAEGALAYAAGFRRHSGAVSSLAAIAELRESE